MVRRNMLKQMKIVLLTVAVLHVISGASFQISRIRRSTNRACLKRPLSGMCLAYFVRYYYNATSDTCNMFVYGGCGGNANNFRSGEACVEACGGTIVEGDWNSAPVFSGSEEDFYCQFPPDRGHCNDTETRFYYDGENCNTFEYGGCGGNRNNFDTLERCLETCDQ